MNFSYLENTFVQLFQCPNQCWVDKIYLKYFLLFLRPRSSGVRNQACTVASILGIMCNSGTSVTSSNPILWNIENWYRSSCVNTIGSFQSTLQIYGCPSTYYICRISCSCRSAGGWCQYINIMLGPNCWHHHPCQAGPAQTAASLKYHFKMLLIFSNRTLDVGWWSQWPNLSGAS